MASEAVDTMPMQRSDLELLEQREGTKPGIDFNVKKPCK